MNKFSSYHIDNSNRVELHDKLNLTGAEVSINKMDKGTSTPFIHYHKQNEEIYIVLDGIGKIKLDNEDVNFSTGDCIRVAPSVKRQIFNTGNGVLKYICIQVKENSLSEWTMSDGVVEN